MVSPQFLRIQLTQLFLSFLLTLRRFPVLGLCILTFILQLDYSVCGRGFDSSMTVEDLRNKNLSDTDHSTLQLWPWTVQLFWAENGKSYTPTVSQPRFSKVISLTDYSYLLLQCLGSLVSKNWVLTSALCFRKDDDPRRILIKTGK